MGASEEESSSSSEEEDDNEDTVEVEDGDGMLRRVPGRPAKFQIGRRVMIKGEEGSDDRVAVILSSKPMLRDFWEKGKQYETIDMRWIMVDIEDKEK